MSRQPKQNLLILPSEIYRKAIHLTLGLAAASLPWWATSTQALLLILAVGGLLIIIKLQGWLLQFYKVSRPTMGEVAFPLGVLVAYLLCFSSHPSAFAYGVMIMAVADTGAGLIGRAFGRYYFSLFCETKTWEGSIACWVIAFLLGLIVFSSHGEPWVHGIWPSLLAATGVTIAEALTNEGWDNFVLPIVASILALALGLA